MTCAGCDNCADGHWHLHVTAMPPRNNAYPQAGLIEYELADCAVKLVYVENILPSGDTYSELIPTIHFKGSEAHATYQLFWLGHRLLNLGWTITRMKIEGEAAIVPVGRALYWEAHLKGLSPEARARAKNLRLPSSYNSKREVLYTVRRAGFGSVYELAHSLMNAYVPKSDWRVPKIEACVLDTAPELDALWIGAQHAAT